MRAVCTVMKVNEWSRPSRPRNGKSPMTVTSASDTITLRAHGSTCIVQTNRLSLAQLRYAGRSEQRSMDWAANSGRCGRSSTSSVYSRCIR